MANDTNETNETTIDLNNLYVEYGGSQIKGLGGDGLDIPPLPDDIVEKAGVDTVTFIRKHRGSLSLDVVVSLDPKSKSVKVLKGHALAGSLLPFRAELEDIGLYFEALDCVVRESGGTKIDGGSVSDVVFTIKCKNFVKLIGLN